MLKRLLTVPIMKLAWSKPVTHAEVLPGVLPTRCTSMVNLYQLSFGMVAGVCAGKGNPLGNQPHAAQSSRVCAVCDSFNLSL